MASILEKAKAKVGKGPPPPPKKPAHLTTSTTQSEAHSTASQAGKRGIGWPWDHPVSLLPLFQSDRISFIFNWELWVPEGLPNDGSIEWVPTVRTAAQVKDIDPFLADITTNKGVKIKHLLGFNEPEIPDQANLSVSEAVKLWKEHVLPAKEKFGVRLGSPGMSSDTSRCKPWLNEFFASFDGGVQGSGIDFLVVHWYGTRFEDMASFLGDMHATYGLPVWLNEFACSKLGGGQTSEEEVKQFLQLSVPWLDQLEWVEKYAYYGNGQGKDVGEWVGRGNNFLMDAEARTDTEGKALSEVGKLYTQL